MSESTTSGIEGLKMAAATWNGAPTTLKRDEQVDMTQTPNGTVILAALNKTTGNNEGKITITSAASPTQEVPLDAGAAAPWTESRNYRANNLRITNTSEHADTPVLVQAIGPGISGVDPKTIVIGTGLELDFGAVAHGSTRPQNMQLRIASNSPTTAIVGIIGGPNDASGNNGKVIAVNFRGEKPEGYYAVTPNNSYTFDFNFNGGRIFVGNLSASTADKVTITLRAL